MFGVSPIEMIVEIALSLLAVMCNFHNHFCPAELLQVAKRIADTHLTVYRFRSIRLVIVYMVLKYKTSGFENYYRTKK